MIVQWFVNTITKTIRFKITAIFYKFIIRKLITGIKFFSYKNLIF